MPESFYRGILPNFQRPYSLSTLKLLQSTEKEEKLPNFLYETRFSSNLNQKEYKGRTLKTNCTHKYWWKNFKQNISKQNTAPY